MVGAMFLAVRVGGYRKTMGEDYNDCVVKD